MMSAIGAYNVVYWLLYWALGGCHHLSDRQVLNQTLSLHIERHIIVGYSRQRQSLESNVRLYYGTFIVKRYCPGHSRGSPEK